MAEMQTSLQHLLLRKCAIFFIFYNLLLLLILYRECRR
ncbi:Uncharacterised protein [Segatella copri]|nr:Uncharacterised protein [Segatella copri]